MTTRYQSIFFILLFYCIIPILSQENHCTLPLSSTKYESITDHNGCALFCNSNDAATPWTDRITNKNISLLFLAFLILAFVCNLIFTFNNISEHRENEETFDTTPITYDALFVIDVAYLLVIICLIIPHFSYFDGGNTVSSTYICNSNESTLSLNNPVDGSNALCTIFGLFIFCGFKIILIYTTILCVNIWYRLWKPMVDVGMKKKYLHCAAFCIVFIFAIFMLAFGGIDANASNGMCYISHNNTVLLLIMDIIPNILFIIISSICVIHAARQIKMELKIIQQADLVTDDLVNLIHRMTGFLVMAVLSSAFIVFTEIIWLSFATVYNESVMEWIECAQQKVLAYDGWKYEYGDECIFELKKGGNVFPNEMFFIAFPIAALLSNIAIIMLTCHRRQLHRWTRAGLSLKSAFSKISLTKFRSKKQKEPRAQLKTLIESSNALGGSTVALKGNEEKSPSDVEDNENNDTNYNNIETIQRPLSINVRHSPQNSNNSVEQIGTVRYNTDTNMSFANDTPTPTPGTPETPAIGLPQFNDSNTMIRHPTDSKTTTDYDNITDVEEYELQVSRQAALQNKDNALSMDEQTEMLIQMDRKKSEQKHDRLEHIANASFDYHNLTKQGKAGVPLAKILKMDSISDEIAVYEDDINKSEALNARLASLQLTDSIPKESGSGGKRDSVRSKTLPIIRRGSTQNHFVSYLEEALDDGKKKALLQKQGKSSKSVRFVSDENIVATTPSSINDEEHLVAKKVANVILRSATDSIVKKVQDESDIELQKKREKRKNLKKTKTSIDATNIITINVMDEYDDDKEEEKEDNNIPEIGDRRLSQQERQQLQVKHVTERHKRTFLNPFGKRKKAKQIKKKLKKLKKKNTLTILKFASEFKTSLGTSLFTPSTLLKPVTMESQYNIDIDSYFDESGTELTYSTQDTFETIVTENESNNTLDVLLHDSQSQKKLMQWQSMTNIFHFTLTDNEFKSVLHTTFTPHSTRNSAHTMTFDPNNPFGEIKENEETETVTPLSKLNAATQTQSMNDLKCDRSVTGIGSDGKIVLSDLQRFKAIGVHSSSVPLAKNKILSEDEEYEYDDADDDVKYAGDGDDDDDETIKQEREVKKMESHHRTETVHGRLLDSVPHADRKDLQITIHADFSCQVAEKRKHYKAETAKLAFTLKPVHNMKILM